MTDDLAAASQYLHGLKVGNPLFFAYFRKLALPNTPYVLEKIKMLTSG